MFAKVREKERALELRRKGYSYRDILTELPLAKSTLSSWLKDLPLTEDEKRYLKSRCDSNISRGRIKAASANHQRRVVRDLELFAEAKEEFLRMVSDAFFQVGVALYWAEGAKRSDSFGFTNSDPEMVELMIRWIRQFLQVTESELGLRLYIHKPYAHENCEQFWLKITGLSERNLKKTIYKPTGRLVKKRPNYKGCVRLELMKTRHLRRLKFWQQLLIEHYRKGS